MSMQKIIIGKNEAGQRLDRFLRKFLTGAGLGHIYRLIRKDVKVDGRRRRPDYILKEGQELFIYMGRQEIESLTNKKAHYPLEKEFSVAYEDDEMLAVCKPAGLLVHEDRSERKNTLTNQVISYLIDKGDYNPDRERTFVPAAANRLDRNTSGLVVFGKTGQSIQELNSLFRTGQDIERAYLAIVKGKIDGKLDIGYDLVKAEGENKVELAGDSLPEKEIKWQKDAKTSVKPIIFNDQYSLIELVLYTGRTHQIRAHMAAIGKPILGDPKYGDLALNEYWRKKFELEYQMLHAFRLKICNTRIKAPLPGKWAIILQKCFGCEIKNHMSNIML